MPNLCQREVFIVWMGHPVGPLILSATETHLCDGVGVVDVPPPRVEVLVVDVDLVLPGATGLVARVHDGAGLLQRRHRLLQRRQVLLLELVRQVALDLAV